MNGNQPIKEIVDDAREKSAKTWTNNDDHRISCIFGNMSEEVLGILIGGEIAHQIWSNEIWSKVEIVEKYLKLLIGIDSFT